MDCPDKQHNTEPHTITIPDIPVIMLVDMDAFFVSVEQAHNPDLRDKPVIVGGRAEERHGVVCSASYEARVFGIRSGMPLFKALKLCPHAIVVSTSHGNYREYSRRLETILQDFSPLVEMASIDEAYVDLTGTEQLHHCTPHGIAQKIRDRIRNELELPASFGIASSRIVAKIAADIAKPQGLLWIVPGKEREFLKPLPIGKMPGIGLRSAELLKSYGFTILGDIQNAGEEWMVHHLGKYGHALYQHACGIGSASVHIDDTLPKSVNRSYTFAHDLSTDDEIYAALSYLCEHVSIELRRLRVRALKISLCIRFNDFVTIERSSTLSHSTCDEIEIYYAVRDVFKRVYDYKKPIRLLGVSASNFSGHFFQGDMFSKAEEQKRRVRLHMSIDRIKQRYGFDSIIHGSSFDSRQR